MSVVLFLSLFPPWRLGSSCETILRSAFVSLANGCSSGPAYASSLPKTILHPLHRACEKFEAEKKPFQRGSSASTTILVRSTNHSGKEQRGAATSPVARSSEEHRLEVFMGRPKKGRGSGPTDDDLAWSYCSKVNPENHLNVRCNFCGKAMWGGVFRMKHHLARTKQNIKPCSQVDDDVANLLKKLLEDNKDEKEKKKDDMYDIGRSSDYYFQDNDEVIEIPQEKGKRKGTMDGFVVKGKNPKQSTLNHIWKKGDRESVVLAICRFFYANALPFNVVKSPFFAPMMEAVAAFGPGLKLPSYHEVRHTFLHKEVQLIEKSLDQYRKEWSQCGCTLMTDGWTDGKNRSITNFLVNSPRGTVFIKSVDTSSICKNAQNMFELIDSVVEEIGEEHVVQVVTDSAAALVKAGEFLMEKRKKIFWSPCSAHLLDLMLGDIGKLPTHATTVAKARKITVFIYTHIWVLNLMRKFTKGRELIRAAVTRFATNFLTLKSIHEQRVALRSMFASKEWEESSYSKNIDGMRVRDIILVDQEFWGCIKYCIKCVTPLVKVLRLVDSDERPPMGYIYEAMDRAKEAIAKNFDNVKKRYDPIWRIVDSRWNLQLHRPLHAAAYFLNPAFQYDEKFHADFEVKKGLYDTLERFVRDSRTRILVDEQIDYFKRKIGMFGRETAQLTIKTKQPALWWESYGDHCPELQKLAIRILSLTCSSSGCERNWSTFEQIHSKRRNRLEQQRLNSLVFVKYNLNLQVRQNKRERDQALDPICLSDMESDDEWITEKEDPVLDNDMSWMDLGECFVNTSNEGTSRQDRRRGPRKLTFGRKDKGKKKVSELEEEEALVSSSDNEEEEVRCLDDGSSSFGDDDIGDDDVDVDMVLGHDGDISI
ncbi:hypothetical protein CKAN_01766500 [Cinnamomum micranthum f. kanehirae]|uniref:BED-type domain-containing protein n=1 Tax=Cinnamomum micranthum f. kanehirae TaxID=337451 RepID=A0A3S3NB18_9MAGN|nr:hypothetical protein CKAN_01766500 [Cinnamomum micranthum f. kanehirae]